MLLIANVILLISISTFSASSTAELYRCIDSNGKTNFTDRPCSGDAVDTFDASELTPINTSERQDYRKKNKAGNYVTRKYEIRYSDGTVKDVSKAEYDAQMQKNKDIAVKKHYENSDAKVAQRKASSCLSDRQALERIQSSQCRDARNEDCQRIAGVSSERAYHRKVKQPRQRLQQNCGG